MTYAISGQEVLDAWKATHKEIDDDTQQLCLNAPSFLYTILFLPFNLENQAKVEIEMWKYLADAQVVGPIGAAFNINRLNDVLSNQDELLNFHSTTEKKLILKSIKLFPGLVEKYNAGTLTIGDILITAPGILFDDWNKK